MSDTKGTNLRLSCPFCKEEFLTKSYSNHLIFNHKDELFLSKNNKKALEETCTRKEGSWFSPIELIINGKELYLVSCCNKFYSKKILASKHAMKKDCRDCYLKNAKELLGNISTNINMSGNNNTNTVSVTNNYNFYDLSGNLLQTISKEVNDVIDDERYNKTCYYKKLKKLKSIFKDDPRYDSDYSTVDSAYDSDDESEPDSYFTKLQRYDLTKELDKKIIKKLAEMGLDLSREGLDMSRVKEVHQDEKRQKKELAIEELEDKIITCNSVINDAKEDIEGYEERLRDADDEDEYTTRAFKRKIIEAQRVLDIARREKPKYEEQLKKLKGR
jgi:hypothetical protein